MVTTVKPKWSNLVSTRILDQSQHLVGAVCSAVELAGYLTISEAVTAKPLNVTVARWVVNLRQ